MGESPVFSMSPSLILRVCLGYSLQLPHICSQNSNSSDSKHAALCSGPCHLSASRLDSPFPSSCKSLVQHGCFEMGGGGGRRCRGRGSELQQKLIAWVAAGQSRDMSASETDLVLHRGHYGNSSFNVFIPQGHMEEDKLAGLSAAQFSVWQWASDGRGATSSF